jgi:hypothetical protein
MLTKVMHTELQSSTSRHFLAYVCCQCLKIPCTLTKQSGYRFENCPEETKNNQNRKLEKAQEFMLLTTKMVRIIFQFLWFENGGEDFHFMCYENSDEDYPVLVG